MEKRKEKVRKRRRTNCNHHSCHLIKEIATLLVDKWIVVPSVWTMCGHAHMRTDRERERESQDK